MPMLTCYVPVPHGTGRHKDHVKKTKVSVITGRILDDAYCLKWNLQLPDDLVMKQPSRRRGVNPTVSGDNYHYPGLVPAFNSTLFLGTVSLTLYRDKHSDYRAQQMDVASAT